MPRVLIEFDYSGTSSDFADSILYSYCGEKKEAEFVGEALAHFADLFPAESRIAVWREDPAHELIFKTANRQIALRD